MAGIRSAVAIGILEHDNAIAFGLTSSATPLVNTLRDPDSFGVINVNIGWISKQRRVRPQDLWSDQNLHNTHLDVNMLLHKSVV